MSVRTARRWQAAGLLPPRIRISRTFKYDRADVVKLRDSFEQRARAQKTEACLAVAIECVDDVADANS
jgi:hypothetical protein